MKKSILLSIGLLAALSSCVSKKKYDQLLEAEKKLQSQLNAERRNAQDAEKTAKAKIGDLEKQLADKGKSMSDLQATLDALKKNCKDLENSYNELLELNKHLKEEASENKRQLSERLADKDAELQRKEEELKKLEKELAAREARMKELENALAERDRKAQALRDALLKALAGFSNSDLTVYEKDGKVYVSLSQNLLFAKGSATLDTKGVSALTKLAAVLNKPESTEIAILVEGHTDSDGDEKLNWKLSGDRSLTVVQQLISNGVNPARLTAAGRGEHSPLVLNDTEPNKSKNRRTDIILEPKLDEIYKALNGN